MFTKIVFVINFNLKQVKQKVSRPNVFLVSILISISDVCMRLCIKTTINQYHYNAVHCTCMHYTLLSFLFVCDVINSRNK